MISSTIRARHGGTVNRLKIHNDLRPSTRLLVASHLGAQAAEVSFFPTNNFIGLAFASKEICRGGAKKTEKKIFLAESLMVSDELLTNGDFYENFLSRGIGAEILHSRG